MITKVEDRCPEFNFIEEKIRELGEDEFLEDVTFIVIAIKRNQENLNYSLLGNGCPRCALNVLTYIIVDNNLQHHDDEIEAAPDVRNRN